MIKYVLLGLGLVAVIEGLVLVLAPSRLEDIMAALNAMKPDHRRAMGILAMLIGVVLVWLSGVGHSPIG